MPFGLKRHFVMNSSEKEILFKDISGRLPYDLKVLIPDIDKGNEATIKSGVYTLDLIDKRGFIELFEVETGLIDISDIKPVLFPMDAINQEIEINGKKICIKNYINKYSFDYIIEENGDLDISDRNYLYTNEYTEVIEIFQKYHIDYQNLIAQGLAISVFDLAENPYK